MLNSTPIRNCNSVPADRQGQGPRTSRPLGSRVDPVVRPGRRRRTPSAEDRAPRNSNSEPEARAAPLRGRAPLEWSCADVKRTWSAVVRDASGAASGRSVGQVLTAWDVDHENQCTRVCRQFDTLWKSQERPAIGHQPAESKSPTYPLPTPVLRRVYSLESTDSEPERLGASPSGLAVISQSAKVALPCRRCAASHTQNATHRS
jgi:hypothetical protein